MESNKFSAMLHKRTNKITHVLIYSVLEWTLIFLLLLNSLFSYFILKFALYFGLKPPCFLCSRLDHFLDSHNNEKQSFSTYKDIICEQHAAEISKIGYCSNHQKLVESKLMCNNCSSCSSFHDLELCKWMTEIGIVKTDEEDDVDNDVLKKCSCCDEVINSIRKDSSRDFVIKGRELLGDCFSDQKLQVSSDQFDGSKFEYQILGEGVEEDVMSETEKEPLLDNKNDSNGKKKEFFTTHNLSLDMLPQHLEFYIDHDDYRLIPVGLNHGNSNKVVEEEEKKEYSGFSREFELVFEGDELVFPGCEVTTTSKDLPSIQEEEESVTDNLTVHKDQEKMNCSERFELVSEGGEALHEEVTIVDASNELKLVFEGGELLHEEAIDEENLDVSSKFELGFEGDELLQGETITENLQIPNDEEKMDGELLHEAAIEEEKMDVASEFEGDELLQEEPIIQNLQILNDEEKMDGSSKFEGGELLHLQEEKETIIETLLKDGSGNYDLVFEGDELNAECEIIRENSQEEDEESAMRNSPIREEQDEKDREIDIPFHLEEQEETASGESTPIMNDNERDEAIGADSQATVGTPATSSVSKEDNASHLKTDDTDTEEKNQNPTDNILLVQESEEDIASHLKKQESFSMTDNVVSEVSTSYPHVTNSDAETSEVSLNAKVGMSCNEVEEEKVPDTPTSSESASHLQRKLMLLERRESATEESLDGMSMISEQESAETMEKLKVDLFSERKTLRALYKELEEERNASAISANQTMAMITRLQEEKANMQMEALQYQRMMEEQSEYDQEALQMMNELVVKREKEKQELEKELEVYRKKVMDYEEREKLRMLCRRRSRNSSASCSYGEESDGLSVDLNQEVKEQEEEIGSPHSHEENGQQDTPADAVLCLQDSLSGFEDERQAILGQLKVLEEKLFTLAEEEEEQFENMKPFEQFYEENGKDFEGNNGFIHVNGKHQQEKRMNGSMQKRLLPLFDAADLLESPNGELNGNEDHEFHITKFELEKKRFAIEEEVDHVYERLHSLEADREFLKHCIGSLRKGDKGLDLLQEILQHLRDLKNVELQAMKNMDQCASA